MVDNMTKQKKPQGYKETQVGWIPEEWECPSVFNACDVIVSPVDKKTKDGESLVQLCNYTDVYYNKRITSALDFMKASASKREIQKCALRKGDVVITKDSETPDDIGVPTFIAEDIDNLVCGYHLTILRSKSYLLGEYLSYVLQLHIIQYEFFRFAAGVTRFGLTADTYKQVHLPLPSLPEQKKIAAILGKWDEGIEKVEKLIEVKEKLKKGLMQQLLTGKKRFKEFKGQEWKKYRIGDLLKEVKRPIVFNDNELYKLISIRRRSGGLFLRESLYGHQIKVKDLRTAHKDDFLISKMQVVRGALGLTTSEFDGMKISGSYVALISRDPKKLNIEFFNFLTHQPEMYHKVYRSCYGVHIEKMTFNMKLYFQEKVLMPPSIKEQQEIASILNAADKEIELLCDKLEALKNQKKGLMQKLLTGKLRVKL